jgi:hypothetical protein
MKTYGEVDAELHSFLTSALDEGEWSASRSSILSPGNEPHARWIEAEWVLDSGYCGENKSTLPLPQIEPFFLGRSSHSQVSILTEKLCIF